MASGVVTIGAPILQPGEVFRYRYREWPDGLLWTPWATSSIQTITVGGISSGMYEMEVKLVRVGGIHCDSVFKVFQAEDDDNYDCNSWTVTQINGQPQWLKFEVNVLPANPYPCGYLFRYREAGTTTWMEIPWPFLPSDKMVHFPVPPGFDYEYEVHGNLCDHTRVCAEGTAPYVPPECTPIVITSAEVQTLESLPNGNFQVIVKLTIANSSPASTSVGVNIGQTGVLAPYSPTTYSSTAATNAGAGSSFVLQIPLELKYMDHNIQPAGYKIAPKYRLGVEGTVSDDCGNSRYFSAHIDI